MQILNGFPVVLAPFWQSARQWNAQSPLWAQQPCSSGYLTQLHTNPKQPRRHMRNFHAVRVASLIHSSAADNAALQHQQVLRRRREHSRLAVLQQSQVESEGRGRLLIRRQPCLEYGSVPGSLSELRGGLPRGVTACLTMPLQAPPSPPQQQQPQQRHKQQRQREQQQPGAAQSLRDKNMSFSGALKQLQCLDDWLVMLGSSQWGPSLRDLDGVSVVGALVWLIKSSEWAALQQGGATASGAKSHQQRERSQHVIQALLDRAWALVVPSQLSSSSSTVDPTAGAADVSSSSSSPAAAPLMRPAELASLIYCTSKLQQTRPQLLAAAAAALHQDLYACSTVELFRLIWGLAAARVNPGDSWLLSYCKAAQAKFFMSSASQLAIMAYGLARLGYRPPDIWISAWLEASEPVLRDFSPQNLTNAAWGLSCWRFQAPSHWMGLFYTATEAAMPSFSTIGISQLQLALVTLAAGSSPPDSWLTALLAAAEPLFCDMELLQLCNFGWGLAQWKHSPPARMMAEYLTATEPLLAAGTPTDLSTMLWICDKLSYVPHQSWLSAWFAATSASLPRFEPQHLTTIAIVLGRWGLVPVPGFSVAYWRCTKARFMDFTAYQSGQLIWGLGKAKRAVPNTWATALLATFTRHQLDEAEAVDVCRLIGGFGRIMVKPRGSRDWVSTNVGVQQQFQRLCSWLQPRLCQLEPRWLLALSLGLKAIGLSVTSDFVQDMKSTTVQLDELLTDHERKVLLQAIAALQKKNA